MTSWISLSSSRPFQRALNSGMGDKKMSIKSTLRAVLGIVLAGGGAASCATSKISRDLQNLPSGTSLDVIVQFASAPTKTALSSVTVPGGTLNKQLGLIKGALYHLPAAAISALNNNPNVKYVTPDRKLKGHLEFAEP